MPINMLSTTTSPIFFGKALSPLHEGVACCTGFVDNRKRKCLTRKAKADGAHMKDDSGIGWAMEYAILAQIQMDLSYVPFMAKRISFHGWTATIA